MEKSIWQTGAGVPEFETLKGDKKTDVLIIGGGICGILCAYFLKQAGVDYILVEGEKIAGGITKNTTAKITSLHGLIYDKLIHRFGAEAAKKYFQANENAVQKYAEICKNINCDFEKRSAFTYSTRSFGKIEKELKALESLGAAPELCTDCEIPVEIVSAVKLKNQAQVNPLKFIAEISKNLNIYENTFIRDITPTQAISANGKITAKKIIVTTHFPFINKHGSYFIKLYQQRSYVLALENAQKLEGMYIDESPGFSFRSYGDILLLGGGGHRTGKKGGAWHELEKFQQKYYPKSKAVFKWATQDCMSLDNMPYIGQYSANTPNLFVATGFNKWGMSTSMAAAEILCDLVQEKENEFAGVFSPSRGVLTPQLFVNGFDTLTNFVYPTVRRCPHLGCALKWNSAEHTWDCPCHGSRFEENGKLIDNPATGDAKVGN